MTYERALIIAALAHEGQLYGNVPYVLHPIRVAARVTGDAVLVALLHDVVENTPAFATLIAEDVPGDVMRAVGLLTRGEETYAEYIERIVTAPGRAGRLARVVKRADLEENLSNDPAEGLRLRYLRALTRLEETA